MRERFETTPILPCVLDFKKERHLIQRVFAVGPVISQFALNRLAAELAGVVVDRSLAFRALYTSIRAILQ